jgi:negative regulator of sigma-B (phosphoserine phosphatase)
METLEHSAIEWGYASRALPGQPTSGDLQVVRPFPGGVLIAVLDGIGHGGEAAVAALTAGAILEKHAGDPVIELVQRCHEALRYTRGVAMSIASFSASEGLLTWLAVGNVEGILLRQSGGAVTAEESLLLRAGVVGLHLPALEVEVVPVSERDTLIFTTDGIQNNFSRGLSGNGTPQRTAEDILARHGKTSDDALVLVARFFPGRHESA